MTPYVLGMQVEGKRAAGKPPVQIDTHAVIGVHELRFIGISQIGSIPGSTSLRLWPIAQRC